MLEILLKYLLPCKHIPSSHRHKINQIDFYGQTADNFLELSPEVMKQVCDISSQQQHPQQHQQQQSQIQPVSKTIGANWNHYNLLTGDSLYSNYHAYLFDARHKITQCQKSCEIWSNGYRFQNTQIMLSKRSERTMDLIRNFLSEFSSTDPIVDTERSGSKQMDSLQSLGESSGYESFKYRPDDEIGIDPDNNNSNGGGSGSGSVESSKRKLDSWKISNRRQVPEMDSDFVEDSMKSTATTLGKFIKWFFKTFYLKNVILQSGNKYLGILETLPVFFSDVHD